MILLGDCLEHMRAMDANSIDAIVTDPPYGLSFMGKKWDYDVPSVDVWAECLRVLKPGGHLLAFAGTRTQHRMAVRIEDAGFEIRDMIAWVYGSGFPKSLDVSKAIDKAAGAERGTAYLAHGNNQVFGEGKGKAAGVDRTPGANLSDPPVTEAARQWQGWGTALKPALEPITMARKPLVGTVAANVLEYGTGAINVDGCRVAHDEECKPMSAQAGGDKVFGQGGRKTETTDLKPHGRWPANLIHDGSDDVLAAFPLAPGQNGAVGPQYGAKDSVNTYGDYGPRDNFEPRRDAGSAARFFYCAKADRSDRNDGLQSGPAKAVGNGATMRECEDADWPSRNGNHHPTVKPTDLMRYLCRLVTPPGGIVLDPFMGSGSTGRAAIAEGFQFIGIELDPEYHAIAEARIKAMQPGLSFGSGA